MHLLVQIGINAFYGASSGAPRTLEHAPDLDLVIVETSLRDRCPNETIWKQVHYSFGLIQIRTKGVQMKPYGSKSPNVWGRSIWVRNGLIQIWTRRCPNEAMWKQIWI